jgi:DNA repair protein RadC
MASAHPPIPLRPRSAARNAFERLGPDGCNDEQLLELALGSTDARLPARQLLDALDGLVGIGRATTEELMAAGLTDRAALRLSATIAIGRRMADAWPDEPWRVRSPADVGEHLVDSMGWLEREELRVLLLDTKNTITARRTVYVGNLAGSSVRVGEVFRDAVRTCAAAIVVVHNHPSGDPAPSGDDLRITAELAQAGRLHDIELLDHVIIGRGRWVSLRAIGALDSARRDDAIDRVAGRIGEVELAVRALAEARDLPSCREHQSHRGRGIRRGRCV